MEWTAINIIISILFIIWENAAYCILRRTKDKRVSAYCAVAILAVYAAMIWHLLTKGATMQQTLLLILASLPFAFIKLKEDKRK